MRGDWLQLLPERAVADGGIAIGLIVGYVCALFMGIVDFSPLKDLPIITIPQPFKYGFSFDFHAFLVAATIYL